MAGWLFGPRGTGIVWGREDATRMSPGGFKPLEHQWAMVEAFQFHDAIGKPRVAGRTHELARQLKEGLAGMPHVQLYTPMDDTLSAGIVCFDVQGMTPKAVVAGLAEKNIVATTTPYLESHARLTPCIYNTAEEIAAALRALRALA
jgi:selenocysteine lyase/cysteine desulfurase